MFKKKSLLKAIEILKKETVLFELIADLQNISDQSEKEDISLVDTNSCLASVIWTKEDIVDHLVYRRYAVTDQLVESIASKIDPESLEECSSGHYVIDNAIDRFEAANEFNATEFYEEVEICPHCMNENIYKANVEKYGYTARCLHCGREIMLCDACLVSDDNKEQKCDWSETSCWRKRKDKKHD